MITGFIMDKFVDKRKGFIWGMRIVFWWVIFCLIFFIISYFIAKRNYTKAEKSGGEGEESNFVEENNSMKDNMSMFMKLEINRRLAEGRSLL
jgi:Na+/melibiose symporter-like transporter